MDYTDMQREVDGLTVEDKMRLMFAIGRELGFVCLEGDDFEEREVFKGEGYLAFIYKEDAGACDEDEEGEE